MALREVGPMRLRILSLNEAVDDRGIRSQGFDVVDETGHRGWLLPSLRLRLTNGNFDLKPGDVVLANDFVYWGGGWPLLVAESIRRLTDAPHFSIPSKDPLETCAAAVRTPHGQPRAPVASGHVLHHLAPTHFGSEHPARQRPPQEVHAPGPAFGEL